MSKISIENWQQVIPRELWREFAIDEAHATSALVQEWIRDPDNETKLRTAQQARDDYVMFFIDKHAIDTSIINMVPYGIQEDMKYRLQLIKELADTATKMVENINDES